MSDDRFLSKIGGMEGMEGEMGKYLGFFYERKAAFRAIEGNNAAFSDFI